MYGKREIIISVFHYYCHELNEVERIALRPMFAYCKVSIHTHHPYLRVWFKEHVLDHLDHLYVKTMSATPSSNNVEAEDVLDLTHTIHNLDKTAEAMNQ